jgi:5-methylcytosine-specific restriction endonuclease McrA
MCVICNERRAAVIEVINGELRSLCIPCLRLSKDRLLKNAKFSSEVIVQSEALTRTQWAEIKASYNYECLCCHRREPDVELVADHVLPKSRGGANTAENTQPLCRSCNAKKYNKHVDYRSSPVIIK